MVARDREARPARAEQRDQHEDELAGVHVAEQSHRQRNGLGEDLDEVQEEVRDPQQRVRAERGGEQLVREAAGALGLDREVDDHREHRERHREGGVEVGGGNRPPVVDAEETRDLARQVERQQVHRVHQEHPHEDREGERGEEAPVEVEDFLDGVVDELDHHLDEGLPLARDAGGGLAGRGAEQDDRHQAEQDGHEHRVDVPGPETVTDREVGQVVGDVLGAVGRTGGGSVFCGGHDQ